MIPIFLVNENMNLNVIQIIKLDTRGQQLLTLPEKCQNL